MSPQNHPYPCPVLDHAGVVWSCAGRASIGDNLSIDAVGGDLKITVEEAGVLAIGNSVFLNFGLDLFVSTEVTIGDYAMIAPRVFISDFGGHSVRPDEEVLAAPVRLGRNTWIGHSAIILPGVSVGANSVIGAGSVVTRDVPANAVAAGVPARVLSTFTDPGPGWIRNSRV